MSIVAPTQQCPDGTKLWFLNLGDLDCDEGFVLRGAGMATKSKPQPGSKFRKLVCLAILIEMPGEDGLILFDTGCAADFDKEWGDVLQDIFFPDRGTEFLLPEQIKKTGHDISQVKHIIINHLHLDHAGGLDYFKGRKDIKIYCHEKELKHAWWAIATKCDAGVYLSHYLLPDMNWETFNSDTLELFPGLHLIHAPGHSPGLILMMIHLKGGTIIATGDMYHVAENYEGTPQGWLMREYTEWFNSHKMIKRLVKQYKAKICLGHDWDVYKTFKQIPEYHT